MTAISSNLAMERYHQLSDATMETLLVSLEELLDSLGRPSYEVEYHVCANFTLTHNALAYI